jgi:hypothetical protein
MTLITKDDPESNIWNARIGYSNLLTSTNGAASEPTLTPTTYDRFTSTSTSVTIKYRMSAVAAVNYIAIAAHNLGTHDNGVGVTVGWSATIGGAVNDVEFVIPPDNTALMFTFDEVQAEEITVTWTSATVGAEIGVVDAGVYMEMQRPIFGGNSPINLSADTKYQSVKSESGNMLGRSITRQGLSSNFSWQNLDDTWVREIFKPFMIAARTTPFFIKWRPDYYSDEVAYGQTTNDIKPANQGGGTRLMNVSFTMDAHSDI